MSPSYYTYVPSSKGTGLAVCTLCKDVRFLGNSSNICECGEPLRSIRVPYHFEYESAHPTPEYWRVNIKGRPEKWANGSTKARALYRLILKYVYNR